MEPQAARHDEICPECLIKLAAKVERYAADFDEWRFPEVISAFKRFRDLLLSVAAYALRVLREGWREAILELKHSLNPQTEVSPDLCAPPC